MHRDLIIQPSKKRCAIYALVSSHRQKKDGDLDRQLKILTGECKKRFKTSPLVFSDIGSELNMRRRGLSKLFTLAQNGSIHTLLITHKDRLACFGLDLLERILNDYGVRLEVLYQPEQQSPQEELGSRTYRRKAGADRGVRVPIVLSVRNGEGEFVDEMVSFDELISKRDYLRDQTRGLTSRVRRMRNNWEQKHTKKTYPGHLLKKDRHLSAIWRKIRRLDTEIARQVASQTVWFCEEYGVKTLYFENLKDYSAPAGWGTLSWRLSSNLFSKVLDTVTYMRQSLGHRRGGVWTVSPAWTSQKCHVCGEKGVRVESEGSTEERKGGEYFHCESCGCSLHADVNAARNIIDVKSFRSSAVAGQLTLT